MPPLPLALAFAPGPLTVLALSVVLIIAAIVWFRLHAFFAFCFAAIFVGLMTALG